MTDPNASAATGDHGTRAHVKLVESYFDQHAQTWSDLYRDLRGPNDLVLAARKEIAVALLCEALPPGEGVRVLDAGCGAGAAALDLVRRGFYVHGFDLSSKMLDLCRMSFEAAGISRDRYAFSRTDLLRNDFGAGAFDAVIALGFLQYFPDEGAALRALHRLLKPDGVLVVTGPNGAKPANWFGLSLLVERGKNRLRGTPAFTALKRAKALLLRRAPASPDPDRVINEISPHHYSERRFRTLLREAGFVMLRHRGHGFVGFPMRRLLGLRGEIGLHRALTRLAAFLPLGRWGNDLVVLARKSG